MRIMHLTRFFDNSTFSDIVIQAAPTLIEHNGKTATTEGRKYYAHRMILASASPYLETMINNRATEGCLQLPTSEDALDIVLRFIYGLDYTIPGTIDMSDPESPVKSHIFDRDKLCAMFEEIVRFEYKELSADVWRRIVWVTWEPWYELDIHLKIFGLTAKYKMQAPMFDIRGDVKLVKFLLQFDDIGCILRLTQHPSLKWVYFVYWAALHPTIVVSQHLSIIEKSLPLLIQRMAPSNLTTYHDIVSLTGFFALLWKQQYRPYHDSGDADAVRHPLMTRDKLERLVHQEEGDDDSEDVDETDHTQCIQRLPPPLRRTDSDGDVDAMYC